MTNNQLTEAELTETLDAATSGYPLTASAEANLRRVFAELQERRKAEAAWRKFQGMLNSGDPAASQQPAPVVLDFKKLALELVGNLVDCGGLDEGVKERYLEWAEKTCRAAMLVAAPQEVKP